MRRPVSRCNQISLERTGFSNQNNTPVKANPTVGAIHLSNMVPAQGGLPIMVGMDAIGAIGVSGAPGGDKDEACAKAGIDKVAGDLR